MKTDEKTAQAFKEFVARHRGFETSWGPVEKGIEYFLDLSQRNMIKVNEQIEVFFDKTNSNPRLLTPKEAETMPVLIPEVTKYLNEFAQFVLVYNEYCLSVGKYYETQKKILETVNEANISIETWHLVYVQKEYLDDLETVFKSISETFASLTARYKNLWAKYKAIGYEEEV